MKLRSLVAVAAALLMPSALLAAGPWTPRETVENGVPVVMNPATPRDGETVLGAAELWRLGADEENDPLFGRLSSAVTDDEGNAFVLDANLSLIHVVDGSGNVMRTIGGEGDGPGEFRNANELIFMPDGDLGILEMMPGNVVVMDRNGEPRSSYRPGKDAEAAMLLPQHLAADEDGVVIGRVSTSFGHDKVVTRYSLERYALDGTTKAVIRERSEEQSGGNVSLSLGGEDEDFTRNWELAGDGRVVVFQSAYDYVLEVFGLDGKPERIIRREYETLRRPEKELAAARRQAEEMSQRNPQMQRVVPENARDIRAVHARADGELWVACSEGDQACPEGSFGVFDVYDGAGHYVRQLRIDGIDYDRARDEYVIDGDRVYVFKEAQMVPPKTTTAGGGGMTMMMISGGTPDPGDEEESGPVEVICYRIEG